MRLGSRLGWTARQVTARFMLAAGPHKRPHPAAVTGGGEQARQLGQARAAEAQPAPCKRRHQPRRLPGASALACLIWLSLPSVVTLSPSAVRTVMSALASKAVAWALVLQNTSRYAISPAAASPANAGAAGFVGQQARWASRVRAGQVNQPQAWRESVQEKGGAALAAMQDNCGPDRRAGTSSQGAGQQRQLSPMPTLEHKLQGGPALGPLRLLLVRKRLHEACERVAQAARLGGRQREAHRRLAHVEGHGLRWGPSCMAGQSIACGLEQ